jgi:hypothetical protein
VLFSVALDGSIDHPSPYGFAPRHTCRHLHRNTGQRSARGLLPFRQRYGEFAEIFDQISQQQPGSSRDVLDRGAEGAAGQEGHLLAAAHEVRGDRA